MRVSDNIAANNIILEMEQLSSREVQLQSQVSTGLSVSQASDSPGEYSTVMSDNSQSKAISQYSANGNQAVQISNATLSALQGLNSVADKASQVAIIGSAASTSASSMASYAAEIDGLIQQTVQMGNSQYNNSFLFSGTATTTAPYVTTVNASGSITGVTYAGNTTQSTIPISESSNIAVGSDSATNQGLATFMNNLIALRDALNAGDSASVTTAQTALASSENVITNEVAVQGALQTRIQITQAQQTSLATQLGQDVSNITSTDLATTSVQLTQAQNAYQAAVQSAAALLQKNILTYLPIQ